MSKDASNESVCDISLSGDANCSFVSEIEGGSRVDLSESVNGISSDEVLFDDNCSFSSKPEMLEVISDIPDFSDFNSEAGSSSGGGHLSDRCNFLDQTPVRESGGEHEWWGWIANCQYLWVGQCFCVKKCFWEKSM